MLAVFVVALAQCCLLTSARTVPDFITASNVFRSSARERFDTDHHYQAKVKEYQAFVNDKNLNNHLLAHPTVVRFADGCSDACHRKLVSTFGNHRTMPLDETSMVVTASVAELEAFSTENSDLVKFHFAIIPEMKIDSGLSALTKHAKCDLSSVMLNTHQTNSKSKPTFKKTKSTVTLRLVVAPLSAVERNAFLDFAHEHSQSSETPFDFHYPEKQLDGHQHYVDVTLSACGHTDKVSKLFANRREVIWMERNMPAYTHNRWARGVCDTGNPASYPLDSSPLANFTGRGDIVGISDTGIDMKHCYFRDPNVPTPYVQASVATALTPNFNHRKVVQYYLSTDGARYSDQFDDDDGHGTHVAGTVAGRPIQRYGDYKTYEGMVSDAKIAFFDIGNEDNSVDSGSLIVPTDLNTGMFSIMYLAGTRIFSNSWGTSNHHYDIQAVQVDTFMWNNPDALVLFSAGNSGEGGARTINSPSTNKNGISVGASLNHHDSWLAYEVEKEDYYGIDAVAGFSSQGPTTDNRMKPTILAPGYWTTSARGNFNSSKDFCDIRVLRGTSMACPTAAGYAVKIRRYFLDGFYPSGARNPANSFTPSGALIKAVLVHSGQRMQYRVASEPGADGIHAVTEVSAYPSNMIGYGRIKMNSVLHFSPSTTNPVTFFVIGGATPADANYRQFTAAGTHTYTFTTSSSASQHAIRVTLSYTDYPGSVVTTASAMVNDIRVSVNGITPYLVSGNIRDNTQVIDIPNPAASTTYTVTVSAMSITQSPQAYALVVTGSTTYIADGPSDDVSYSIPEDNFTAEGGALKYILALGFLSLLLAILVYYIRRLSRKKPSMLADSDAYDEDAYYEDGHAKKGIFAKIADIRKNGGRKNRNRNVEMEQGYYD